MRNWAHQFHLDPTVSPLGDSDECSDLDLPTLKPWFTILLAHWHKPGGAFKTFQHFPHGLIKSESLGVGAIHVFFRVPQVISVCSQVLMTTVLQDEVPTLRSCLPMLLLSSFL